MDSTQLEERLNFIEARLAAIEEKLNLIPQKNEVKQAPIAEKKAPSEIARPIHPPKYGNWLGIIAVICFVFAAGFIIKLSIESGWLTPAKQLGLAALLGLALIASGTVLLSSDRSYAGLLPASGIIILYITLFAAYRYYFFLSFQTAIAMLSLNSGMCVWFYKKIKHDLYAIIAAIGAYLGPFLLTLNTNAVFSLYYLIICSFTFATISICLQSRTLTVISAYLAILVTSFIGLHMDQDLLLAIVLALYFLIFSIGTYYYTQLTKQELTEKEGWSLFPVLLIFYAMEYYFIDRIQPGLAPWISLGFAAVLGGLYLSAKKWFPERSINSQIITLAFVTIVCFHSIYLELLPAEVRPWLFVIIVLGFSFPIKTFNAPTPHTYLFPKIALCIIVAIEYLNMLDHLMGAFSLSWFMVSMASFISIWLMINQKRECFTKRDEYGYILLGTAHLLAISGLYQITADYGSLAVSASWLFYAIAVMSFAFIRKDKLFAKSALLILSFAAGKALLYDAGSTPTVIRILCLMLTGVVLYASGFVVRRMAEWQD
ncbi:putative membrane protein [Legionella massiliensis]|uniref:Putative membrane protein n=1 Tax=Legionella massiliensis TaxID=1034943 RepID=A0A078KY35_9GAMM|nr:DUF2339 domain-containing protein [Legionella massiliensis]CDZ77922.1 putative membrane protein [Legionella massiliensis]CEE13660.1 hypothetical protein BN1094_02216 [Legionella massiliensis]